MKLKYMRIILFLIVLVSLSCSNLSNEDKNVEDLVQQDSTSITDICLDSLLNDTPKIIKPVRDYLTIATSPYDKIYFGDKFSPYKIELYDIAILEKIIDSLITVQNGKGFFKNKTLKSFKYQVFSVKTSRHKLQARVQAICIEMADIKKWNSSRLEIEDGGDCYFSIIYDLTDKKLIIFQINSNG